MHELGIILHIAKTLDETAQDYNITKIGSVTLEVGEVSGVVPHMMSDCWDYFKAKHPVLKDSILKMETVKAITYCEDCEKTYETVKYGRICPYCQSEKTFLLTGRDCVIKEIEAETEEEET